MAGPAVAAVNRDAVNDFPSATQVRTWNARRKAQAPVAGGQGRGAASSGNFSEAWPKKYFQPPGVRT